MICPYCKKEIATNTGFCPECGQDISNSARQNQSDSYWKNVNREDAERSREYKNRINKENKEIRTRKYKALASTVLILIVLVAGAFGIFKFQQYQTQMINQVNADLVGKTLTAHSSHMEGLGWIYHEYWQLTFVDESNLEYGEHICKDGTLRVEDKAVMLFLCHIDTNGNDHTKNLQR